MSRLIIIDTGCANVSSVRYAVERLGVAVEVSRDLATINSAERLLLPGVGSASEAMKNLAERDLITTIKGLTQPVLGICLGMQLLARHSAEGNVDCLGLIPAEVQRLEVAPATRLPHMGWNQIIPADNCPLFSGIPAGSYFYFVHSFALPVGSWTRAVCDYDQSFSAAVQAGNFYGVQFHPERSAAAGARLLKNFVELPA